MPKNDMWASRSTARAVIGIALVLALAATPAVYAFSWAQVGEAGVTGGITGAVVGSALPGLGTLAGAAVGSVAAAGADAVIQLITQQPYGASATAVSWDSYAESQAYLLAQLANSYRASEANSVSLLRQSTLLWQEEAQAWEAAHYNVHDNPSNNFTEVAAMLQGVDFRSYAAQLINSYLYSWMKYDGSVENIASSLSGANAPVSVKVTTPAFGGRQIQGSTGFLMWDSSALQDATTTQELIAYVQGQLTFFFMGEPEIDCSPQTPTSITATITVENTAGSTILNKSISASNLYLVGFNGPSTSLPSLPAGYYIIDVSTTIGAAPQCSADATGLASSTNGTVVPLYSSSGFPEYGVADLSGGTGSWISSTDPYEVQAWNNSKGAAIATYDVTAKGTLDGLVNEITTVAGYMEQAQYAEYDSLKALGYVSSSQIPSNLQLPYVNIDVPLPKCTDGSANLTAQQCQQLYAETYTQYLLQVNQTLSSLKGKLGGLSNITVSASNVQWGQYGGIFVRKGEVTFPNGTVLASTENEPFLVFPEYHAIDFSVGKNVITYPVELFTMQNVSDPQYYVNQEYSLPVGSVITIDSMAVNGQSVATANLTPETYAQYVELFCSSSACQQPGLTTVSLGGHSFTTTQLIEYGAIGLGVLVILVAVLLTATRGPTVLIEGARGRRYALGKESRKEVKTWQL